MSREDVKVAVVDEVKHSAKLLVQPQVLLTLAVIVIFILMVGLMG